MLTLCADLDLALVSIEELQLLLELLPQGLKLCLLGLIKPELEDREGEGLGTSSSVPTILPCPSRPGP